jgi:hypothetical protein
LDLSREFAVSVSTSASKFPAQGYRLRILNSKIEINAADEAGARYAMTTLAQLMRTSARRIRAVEITDWPDFPVRGVMLDISRDKVPTMSTLFWLVDKLADWKFNQLQLYTEHTFAYRGHEKVWRGCSPMTANEIRRLDRYCHDRGIELVPNQNSFGHMERWLKHDPYRRLAETNGPWRSPFGDMRTVAATLNPLDRRSLKLVTGLYDQLLPNFSSRLLNVGCDETFELGQGKSRDACKKRGVGQVYLDFILKLHRDLKKRGRRMMMWSDIVHQHPRLIPRLPKDIIGLIWGYEPDHPFDRQARSMARAGLDFYVCPGTSSWCSFSGRSREALVNIANAARSGLRHAAKGLLVTDWGDFGHRQYLPASFAGFLYAASMSWCARSNDSLDVARAVDLHVYDDAHSSLGALWFEAGRVHELARAPLKNRTILFSFMQEPLAEMPSAKKVTLARLKSMLNRIAVLQHRGKLVTAHSPQTCLSRDELLLTLAVLGHACLRAQFAKGTGDRRTLERDIRRIMTAHRKLWLKRNRPGGLAQSLAHYQRLQKEYA